MTRLTPAQVEWCVAYHAALPLAEIRRRQELAERQIGLAWRQRNEFALANLRVREEILRRAAERKLLAREGIAGRRRSHSVVGRPCCRVIASDGYVIIRILDNLHL